MNGWTLEIRSDVTVREYSNCIDASPIKLAELSEMSATQIREIELPAGSKSVCVGDLFDVTKSADDDTLRLIGDLSGFQHIGFEHDGGLLIVEGDVGDFAGARMSGGEFWVAGSAGDFLAAATASHRVGMSGGRIVVTGSVGHHAGHRMRRGEIAINRSAGDFLADHMIAGTILVAENVGNHVGYAIRRGTLILEKRPELSKNRFSLPVDFKTAFFLLLSKQWQLEDWQNRLPQLTSCQIGTSNVNTLLAKLADGGFSSVRGDLAVAGQGEIVFPK